MGEARRRKAAAIPPSLEELSPEEGIEMIQAGDTSKIYLPVRQFCECFGLTELQFAKEAAAGRISVFGARGVGSVLDLVIPYQSAVKWIARYRMSH